MDDEHATPLARGGFGSLLRSSALFSLGSVAGKVLGVLLLPLVTRQLSPVGFGRYDVMLTLATSVTSLIIAGLDVAATRRYADLDPEGRRGLFATWLLMTLGAVGLAVGILTVGAAPLSQALFGDEDEAFGLVMVGAYAAGNAVQVVGLTVLRNEGRARTYALVSTGAFLVNGAAVAGLVLWRPDPSVAMLGVAIGTVVGGGAALACSRGQLRGRASVTESRALLGLGLPLVPAVVALWVGDFVNRAILLGAQDAAEVGYLSVAVRFGTIAVLVITGFQLAWMPRAFAVASTPEGLARTAREARRIMVVVSVSLVPMALAAPELVRIVAGDAFAPAVPALGWGLITAIGLALFTIAGLSSSIASRLRDLGVAGTAGAVIGVAANVVLAPRAGATGTSAALAVGQLSAAALLAWMGRERSALRLPWAPILAVAGATSVLSLALTLGDPPAVIVRLAAGAAFVAVLAVVGDLGDAVAVIRRRLGARPEVSGPGR